MQRVRHSTGVRMPAGRGEANYRSAIRALARGIWLGVYGDDASAYQEGVFQLQNTIQRGLTAAWAEGAARCGIGSREYTTEEKLALSDAIFTQYQYVGGYIDFLVNGSKAKGGKLGDLSRRTEMWGDEYQITVGKAERMACADKKGQWQLGGAKEHCRSCIGLDGKVYRFSTWARYKCWPKSHSLDCKRGCKCGIVETDERVTPGRFPTSLLR